MPPSSIHIVPTIDREASGPSYSVTRLCRALLSAGCPTKLAVLEPLPSAPGHEFVKAFPYGLGPKRLGVSPQMKRWLRSEALSGKTQILHNHSLWMMPNVYPAMAVRGTSCKLVVSPRGTLSPAALERSKGLKKLMRPFVLDRAVRSASAFHATSQQEYLDIRQQGLRQPVAILPNGVDVPDLLPKSLKPLRQLLFLGRIHPIKGIDRLLKAWGELQDRHTDWQLIIAGPDNGGYLNEMKGLARELALHRCEFVGPLYGHDKHQAYRQADLYVLPTHSENFGMTVAEALAAGTPAMVTTGAPWQGLQQEGAGWWIEAGVEPLVAALDEALATAPDELDEMGQRGRTWMQRDFSWEQIAQDMSHFYKWLIIGGDVPPFIQIK